MEAALRANEKRRRTIFETSNVPMGLTDLNGRPLMANAATERVLG
jgi:PAS domain S-box-containing protein